MKCSAIDCAKDAVWRAQEVRNRVMVNGDSGFCEEHAKLLWESYLTDPRKGAGDVYNVPGAACFELELVMAEYEGYSSRVLLREVGRSRLIYFPIDFVQSYALHWAVAGSAYDHLSVHVALLRLVEHFGGTFSHVLLHGLTEDGIFEARAVIQHQGEVINLDIRPSDGLVVAMMTKLPFLVTNEVFLKKDEWAELGKW
jgi:bifunctional DNase/RNase